MTENDSIGSVAEGLSIPACIPSFFDMKICYSPGCDSLEEQSWYVNNVKYLHITLNPLPRADHLRNQIFSVLKTKYFCQFGKIKLHQQSIYIIQNNVSMMEKIVLYALRQTTCIEIIVISVSKLNRVANDK